MSRNRLRFSRRSAGAALIIAVSLLAIFATLGAFYVQSMSLELDRTALRINEARARAVAEGGLYAAISDLQLAAAERQTSQVVSHPRVYAFPTYVSVQVAGMVDLTPAENRRAEASVQISDESGKINLNHAPASVLQRILNIDGATARAITSNLPRAEDNAEASTQKGWLIDTQDLMTRGLLSAEQYAAVNKDFITTWSVIDHERPAHFINVATAAPEVLAAILDIPLESAQQVAAQKPFDSWSTLVQAVGKDPATFNIKPDSGDPSAWPGALSTDSHCFRLVSESVVSVKAGETEHSIARYRIEAVVVIDHETYEIAYWNAGTAAQSSG